MQNPQKPFTESGTSPPIHVAVTRIDLVPGCTVGTGVGLDADGNEVIFAGDWRPLLHCAEALEAGEDVQVYLDSWQGLAWRRP